MLLETWSAEYFPKSIMAIVLNGHKTHASQNTHDNKKVPETDAAHKGKTSDIYMVRSIAINIMVSKKGLFDT
jgi:hypothetical protein